MGGRGRRSDLELDSAWSLAPLVLGAALAAALLYARAFRAALARRAAHDLQHACFVLAGALVWTQIIDPSRHRRLTLVRRIGFVGALYAFGQLFSYVFTLSFSPFYASYAEQDERLFGLSPLLDQKLAGVVVMVEQTIALGIALYFLLRARRREAERRPRNESVIPLRNARGRHHDHPRSGIAVRRRATPSPRARRTPRRDRSIGEAPYEEDRNLLGGAQAERMLHCRWLLPAEDLFS